MLTKKRIIIVDNQPAILSMTSYALQKEGYSTVVAEAGDIALTLIREEPPDLVITDLDMPRMTGLELARALAGDPQTAAIPVIMVTGNRDQEDIEAGLKCGVHAYILKPIRFNILIAEVNKVLGG